MEWCPSGSRPKPCPHVPGRAFPCAHRAGAGATPLHACVYVCYSGVVITTEATIGTEVRFLWRTRNLKGRVVENRTRPDGSTLVITRTSYGSEYRHLWDAENGTWTTGRIPATHVPTPKETDHA